MWGVGSGVGSVEWGDLFFLFSNELVTTGFYLLLHFFVNQTITSLSQIEKKIEKNFVFM